jgi:hypothetical protein
MCEVVDLELVGKQHLEEQACLSFSVFESQPFLSAAHDDRPVLAQAQPPGHDPAVNAVNDSVKLQPQIRSISSVDGAVVGSDGPGICTSLSRCVGGFRSLPLR